MAGITFGPQGLKHLLSGPSQKRIGEPCSKETGLPAHFPSCSVTSLPTRSSHFSLDTHLDHGANVSGRQAWPQDSFLRCAVGHLNLPAPTPAWMPSAEKALRDIRTEKWRCFCSQIAAGKRAACHPGQCASRAQPGQPTPTPQATSPGFMLKHKRNSLATISLKSLTAFAFYTSIVRDRTL